VAVKTHGEILLFDCGEGTQRQLMRSSLSFMGITKVFITHFHGDHYLGLAGLLQTMALNGRTKDLEIFGPKGTEQLVTIIERISYYSRTFDLVLHEMKENQRERFEGFSITAIRLDHSIPAIGYLFEEDDRPGKFDVNAAKVLGIPPGPLYNKLQGGDDIVWNDKVIEPGMVMGPSRPGRKICIAMDTKPILGLPERIRGFDVLIHEATADKTLEGKANKFGHSTAAQAATIAKEADVKRLFLIHISPRYRDPKPLINEAKAIFEESYLPSDLEEFEIPLPESWEEDNKMWVVDGKVEDSEADEGVVEEGEIPLVAAEGIETPETLAAAENAEAVEVYDEPAPGEAVVAAVDDVLEEVVPAEIEVPVEEPVPAMSDGGISLGAVEAAMESKAAESADRQDIEARAQASGSKTKDEEDEFDLEQAMRDVGIDPEN
jgi:ribonuclease Z